MAILSAAALSAPIDLDRVATADEAPVVCQRVVIVGQGYVGLPLAMRAVEVGHSVVGYEIDEKRVGLLASGLSFVEDVSDAEVSNALACGRYLATSDAAKLTGFDVAIISVPTPLREGIPDLSYVEQASRIVAGALSPGGTVILESTTYPGTTDELVCPLLEAGSGLCAGRDFSVGYSPERIDPGNTTWTLQTTPKVVSGIDGPSLRAVQAFYDTIVDQTVAVKGTREAELTKLLENTFRHVNIALVNELAMFASDLDIDLWAAIDAASTKPFGFLRFNPGPGVGGHCLPIDPSYLSWRVRRTLGEQFRFVELANEVNAHMPDYVVRRLMVALNRRSLATRGCRVLILGLAYKRNTGDAREAPAAVIIKRLLALGAHVRAADSRVAEVNVDRRVIMVQPTAVELASADVVILLTDHDEFDYDSIVKNAQYVLDTRHRVHGQNVEHL